MKKLIALFLCLCLTAGLVPALAENAQFTVRTYPLWDDDSQIGTLDLRFYAEKPNIAYIGFKAYMATLQEVEKGADPDMPIERIENVDMVNPYFPRLTPGDYSPYYNDELLDQLMNEWFAEEVVPAA